MAIYIVRICPTPSEPLIQSAPLRAERIALGVRPITRRQAWQLLKKIEVGLFWKLAEFYKQFAGDNAQ